MVNDQTDVAVAFLGKKVRRESGKLFAEHLFVELERPPDELQAGTLGGAP